MKHTRYDGSFDPDPVEFNPGLHSVHHGKFFHDVLYASGNIYEKIDTLEREKEAITREYGEQQYQKQRELLAKALPEAKPIAEYHLSPISAFVQETFRFPGGATLIDEFLTWAGVRTGHYGVDWSEARITRQDLGAAIGWQDVVAYMRRFPVRGLGSASATTRAEARQVQTQRRDAGEKLFRRFLDEGLEREKRNLLENACNRIFNASADPDFARIPAVVAGLSTVFHNKPVDVKEHQLRAVKFLNIKGSGVIAYGTGLGKTFAGLMATVQNLQMGRCRRPVLVVPRAVYTRWTKEIKARFPELKVNELGNLGVDSSFDPTAGIPDNSLSVITYEGLQALSYSEEVFRDLTAGLQDAISISGSEKQTKFQAAKEKEKTAALAGKGQKGASKFYDVEKLGFDHVTVDESHNFKNLIEKARVRNKPAPKSSDRDKDSPGPREANEFADISGASSDRAARLFLLTQFIQKRNNGRNVFLLSATPFSNSPIEIYSMLQYVARDELRALGLSNVNHFLSTFAELKNDWVVRPGGEVIRKDVVKSFKNVKALQDLIRRNMDFMNAADLGGKVDIPEKRQHVVQLNPTPQQRQLFALGESIIAANKNPGDALSGISLMRQATLSPAHAGSGVDFVESSPKVQFACETIANIYRERPDVGHILYIPEGREHFGEVQAYLKKKGLPSGAVRTIEGGTKLEVRDEIRDSFNSPDGIVKVIIGTRAIMEGVSLNGVTATTFDLFLPWNPAEKIQLEGRAWRQGNRLERTHMLTPVLLDSADPAMLQKHDEKGSRFNDLMSYRGGNTMSVEGISAEELKFDLIKDPEKLAKWMMSRETESQIDELGSLKIASESMRAWAKQYDRAEQEIKADHQELAENRKYLETAAKELFDLKKRKITGPKRTNLTASVVRLRREIKSINERIERQGRLKELVQRNATGRGIRVEQLREEATRLDGVATILQNKIEEIKKNKEHYIEQAKKQIEARSEKAPDLEEQITKYSRLLIDDLNSQKMKQKSFFEWFMERLAA